MRQNMKAAIKELGILHLSIHMHKNCLALACLSLLPVAVGAQQKQTFSAESNLVRVPTLVRDVNGAAVPGLRVGEFIIEDDRVAQAVRLDENDEPPPVSLMVAVQCGRRARKEIGRIAGLASMLDPVLSNPENEAAVLFFDSKLALVRDFTSNGDLVESDLRQPQSGDSGAAILDAVAYSARLLGRRPKGRQRVLLLISETRDHGSKFAKVDDALGLIDANDVSVYALPFSPYISQQLDDMRGSNKDEWTPSIDLLARLHEVRQSMRTNVPKTLASLTGGEYELFSTRKGFENDLINFANHLYSRYELTFEPRNPHPGLHQIHVRLRDPAKNVTLLYRTTYWVAETKEGGSEP